MKNTNHLKWTSVLLIILFSYSCTKNIDDTASPDVFSAVSALAVANFSSVTSLNYNDSIERTTVLGVHLPNPYTIANMKQAYTRITGQTTTPAVTHLYVRFKPSNLEQLSKLDSIMDLQSLDLFDEPLDYQILQEGNYYQDPSIPIEQITWQYAVVGSGFQFPAGITYETLASIHIPTNTAVEQEAERLAGLNADGDGLASQTINVSTNTSAGTVTPNNALECPPGWEWDAIERTCVQTPTPPTPDPVFTPKGRIMVFDNQLAVANQNQPVRTVGVIAKRWFKVQRTFTDNNGNFEITKNFRRRVKLVVRFKNQFSTIRNIRVSRVWQILLPLRYTVGVFAGSAINTVSHVIPPTNDVRSLGRLYWAAATTINAVQEHRDYASTLGFSAPPTDMNIFLTRANGAGSTPLFHKRWVRSQPPIPFINTMLVGNNMAITGGVVALATVLPFVNIDVSIGYNGRNDRSDNLKETIYHEMSHGSHYSRAGANLYTSLVNAELYEITLHFSNNTLRPYGTGADAYGPIIALGEGWAYFMGHFLADRRYGMNSSTNILEQGISYSNVWPDPTLSSHLNLLEDFDPVNRRTADPFWWIPQGLMYDLLDNRNDNTSSPRRVFLNDLVTGYTIQQLSNALQSDITRWQDYRIRLLSQNNNNQAAGVSTIFQFYGY